eukprot:2618168-Rhodomonas_salina.2
MFRLLPNTGGPLKILKNYSPIFERFRIFLSATRHKHSTRTKAGMAGSGAAKTWIAALRGQGVLPLHSAQWLCRPSVHRRGTALEVSQSLRSLAIHQNTRQVPVLQQKKMGWTMQNSGTRRFAHSSAASEGGKSSCTIANVTPADGHKEHAAARAAESKALHA